MQNDKKYNISKILRWIYLSVNILLFFGFTYLLISINWTDAFSVPGVRDTAEDFFSLNSLSLVPLYQ